MRTNTKRTLRCATAVAAFGSLPDSSLAFVAPPLPSSAVPAYMQPLPRPLVHNTMQPMLYPHTSLVPNYQSRLYFSRKEEDNDWKTFKKAGGNLIKRGAEKIKSLNPFGKSEEEKRAAIIQKERKDEIKGGINAMLKDMPLPVRMMGRMVSPLLAKAADQMAEQSRQAQEMLVDARDRITNDPILAEQLGKPIQVGQPFAQSSSSTVINGQSSARVNAQFQVAGPYGNGIATMESRNNQISSLTVNVNGRNISVGSARGVKSSGSSKNGNIIEAEIIEKK